MADKREVKCNGCGHVWSSGAKPKNLKCRTCKSKDIQDNYVNPEASGSEAVEVPTQIKITNRLKKRNTFLADAVRDERDDEFLNREISQRKYKGKLLRTTRIKEYVVSADGFWVTNFIIDLKE